MSISRIELKLHCVQSVESDAEIGQKRMFCEGLRKKAPGRVTKGFRKENVFKKVKFDLHVFHKILQCNMSSDFMR